jgi:phospholipid transport system substrate-binding protein
VADVLGVINSGRGESAMLREFERIFRDYADVPIIAQSVVGPPWRTASGGDRSAFISAFQGYMARKYGRRFREFIGGEITVTGSRPVRNFVEVISSVRIPGSAPFEVRWLVSDGSGQTDFQHDHRGREPDDHRALGNRQHAGCAWRRSGRLASDLRSLG